MNRKNRRKLPMDQRVQVCRRDEPDGALKYALAMPAAAVYLTPAEKEEYDALIAQYGSGGKALGQWHHIRPTVYHHMNPNHPDYYDWLAQKADDDDYYWLDVALGRDEEPFDL
jgi:hypothetical protein